MWTVREYYYNAGWQVLEVRKEAGKGRTGSPPAEPSLAANVYEQFVWSARYVDAPVLRDRDSDSDGVAGDGDLGKSGSGLDERLFYLTDANMNVTALVNTSGAVVERYRYEPYGQVTILDGATGGQTDWATDADQKSDVDNEILFAGYRFDPKLRNSLTGNEHGIIDRDRQSYGKARLQGMNSPERTPQVGIARSVFIALAGALPLFTISPAAPAANYFVSPTGADTNPGTLQRPFATLQRAQQAARQAKGREAVTVSLREGTYYLPETLTFTAEDSGAQEAPRVYQAYQKEQAVISGGARLKAPKWEPHRDGILKAQVPAGLATDQLFVNGQRQPMARYPNFNPNERIYNGYAADAISPQRATRWADPQGGFIHAMHEAMWGGFHYVITGKDEKGNVTCEGGWQNNRPARMHGQYRFVENIFEELDAPGEWYLDAKTATLYCYPPAGVDLSTAVVEAVRLRHLVEFRGTPQAPVGFIALKGLTFRHAARTFMDNKEPLVRSDWTTYRGGAIFYTGAEDCSLEDCFIDQVGGNAVFVNNYNRRVTVRGCHIARAGGNGVAFVGDREAARVPRDWKDRSQTFATLDRTPGPKTGNYPSDCLVDDCLIYLSGRVEKQTAPVQIELAQGITVRHCSIYDVPRAGINIGDGCWGGHVIEFCDIFDTVKETGDHGSFNSWGRDRYWGLSGLDLNDDKTWETEKAVVRLDAVKTVILRNNRWRCDHGWDIDLDDGSTDYHLSNNLCLNGGIKNREGFFRVVENNIMVGSGFHPHVWFKHSEDVVRRNIMWTDHYLPAGGMPSTPWGKEMDRNLVHREGMTEPKPAAKLAEQSKRDAHSIIADAMFVDPANGDFRVKEGSPALKLGFVNFPMDRFGVEKPELKAIARTPPMPKLTPPAGDGSVKPVVSRPNYIWQARVRSISGLGDRSAYGLPGEYGVLVLNVPAGSLAAKAGLQKDDVVLACGGENTAFQEFQVISATPSSKADGQVLDAATCRDKALAAEKALDWPGALEAWERVIDRCAATEAQRVEARTHLKELRPKVPRNTDPRKARPWKVLVVIFRHLDFSWKDGEKTVEVHKTINPDAGRFEGENRPGGDPEYGRTPTETTWMRFYKHIMEDHITRQMWSEATVRLPPGKR